MHTHPMCTSPKDTRQAPTYVYNIIFLGKYWENYKNVCIHAPVVLHIWICACCHQPQQSREMYLKQDW